MDLTDDELAILDLERGWFAHPGRKDAVVLERFGWSPARHAQVLNSLIDRPEAEAFDPQLLRRLRRVREARRRARVA